MTIPEPFYCNGAVVDGLPRSTCDQVVAWGHATAHSGGILVVLACTSHREDLGRWVVGRFGGVFTEPRDGVRRLLLGAAENATGTMTAVWNGSGDGPPDFANLRPKPMPPIQPIR